MLCAVRRGCLLALLVLGAICQPGRAAPGSMPDRPDSVERASWGKVMGWVLDAGTRKPIAGVRVSIAIDGAFPDSGKSVVVTDKVGKYEARAPLGTIRSRFDWGRLLSMHPISLLLSPRSVTKQTKIVDITGVNVRVEAPGYKPFLGRLRTSAMDPRDFSVTVEDVWLTPAATAGVSFSPENLRLEIIDSLKVEPAVAEPGTKVHITLTTHLPIDRGYRYHAYVTSTAIRLVDNQLELKQEKAPKGGTPDDPTRVVFAREVTLPKASIDRWTIVGFYLVRGEDTVLRQRDTRSLLQITRTPEDRPAAEHTAEGFARARAGDRDGALKEYDAARRAQSGYALAHLLYADLLAQSGRAAEAAEAYGKLVALDPRDYAVARSRRAASLLAAGKPDEALAELADAEKALAKLKVPAAVYLVRARAYAAKGNFAESDKALAKAGAGEELPAEVVSEINQKRTAADVAAHPDNSDLRLTYARVLADARRKEEAIVQIRRAAELDPAQPWPYLDLGGALWDLGVREEAVANLEHAVKLAPENAETLLALGDAYRGLGRHVDALPLYRKVVEAQKTNLRARHAYALSLYATGALAESRRELVEVLSQAREKGDLQERGIPMLGIYLGPKRRLVSGFSVPEAVADELLLDSLRDLQLRPENALAYQNLGAALLDLDLPDLALKALEESARRDPSMPETRFLTGIAFRKLGHPEEALRELRAVAAANPLHPRAHLELAQLYSGQGDLERAQSEIAVHSRNYPYERPQRLSSALGG